MNRIPRLISSRIEPYWPIAIIGGLWLWLFWPMLTGQTVCAFRDSGYLYYPLFEYIDSVWASGEIPLWCPYDEYGMPLVADGSSSVFYPGKLIFFFRFLSYPSRYGIYLASHVLLAAMAAFAMARSLKINRAGSTLAGVSYAFGGPVLFQVTNVIYLVSAAWLPLAMIGVWNLRRRQSIRWPVMAGVCCAMMILGGDPQMVYHVGLIALMSCVLESTRSVRKSFLRSQSGTRQLISSFVVNGRWLARKLILIGLMVVTTTLLAAIQLMPTAVATRDSERNRSNQPRNIYEWAASGVQANPQTEGQLDGNLGGSRNDAFTSIFGPPAQGHSEHIYQFSQAPWSLLELLWPNVSGDRFPVHTRWVDRIPGTDRMWTPTIYFGLLSFVCASIGIGFSQKRRRQRWLTCIFIWFLLGSFGWYGLGWLAREIVPGMFAGGHSPLGPQTGGVYWLMVVALPKYFLFRYPAKLLVVAMLALSLLAGIGLSQIASRPGRAFGILIAIGGGSLVLLPFHEWIVRSLIVLENRPNELFGPFQLDRALIGVRNSLLHSAVISAVCLLCLSLARLLRHSPAVSREAVWVLVVVAACDLSFANVRIIADVDAEIFRRNATLDRSHEQQNQFEKLPSIVGTEYRIDDSFEVESSQQRLSEVVLWRKSVWFPKHHLPCRVRNMLSFSSIARARSDWESAEHFYYCRSEEPDHRRSFDDQNQCRVIRFTDNRVVLEIVSDFAMCVSMAERWAPGWSAELLDLETSETSSADVGCTSNGFRSFEVPANGRWQVTLSYMPSEFVIGAWTSGASWLTLVVGCLFSRWRRRIRAS